MITHNNALLLTLVDFLQGHRDGLSMWPNGELFSEQPTKDDIVTLASVNVSPVDFNLGTINDAMKPYWSIIDRRQSVPFVIGLFRFIDKDGDERISIDLNIRVHQAFRANTMRFAAANNQISFWDNLTKTCIPTGGNGETILKNPEHIFVAAECVGDGRPGFPIVQLAGGPAPHYKSCKWQKTIDDGEGKESPYEYVDDQGKVLGSCDHAFSMTSFGEAWWKVADQKGRCANIRQARQHVENLVHGPIK